MGDFGRIPLHCIQFRVVPSDGSEVVNAPADDALSFISQASASGGDSLVRLSRPDVAIRHHGETNPLYATVEVIPPPSGPGIAVVKRPKRPLNGAVSTFSTRVTSCFRRE